MTKRVCLLNLSKKQRDKLQNHFKRKRSWTS